LFPLRIVVIGSGVSGLSAAWLLSRAHDVTLYERAIKPGGHRNTVDVDLPDGRVAVDTGFIVYNPPAYPNLTALFRHLGVDTEASRMTFSVSLEGGGYEYSGSGPLDLFGQPGNLLSPKHWRMVADIGRFFRSAQSEVATVNRSAPSWRGSATRAPSSSGICWRWREPSGRAPPMRCGTIRPRR
jgi:predicted NAD/FAD-binding protein